MKLFGLDTTKSYTEEEIEAWKEKTNRFLDGVINWTIAICLIMLAIAFLIKLLR